MKVAGTYMRNYQQIIGWFSQIVKYLIEWQYLLVDVNISHETKLSCFLSIDLLLWNRHFKLDLLLFLYLYIIPWYIVVFIFRSICFWFIYCFQIITSYSFKIIWISQLNSKILFYKWTNPIWCKWNCNFLYNIYENKSKL